MKNISKIVLLIILTTSFSIFADTKNEPPTYSDQETSITATVDQPEFVIKLKSNPTTGFSWFLREYDSRYLEPIKHQFQAATNHKLMGASGYELWAFKLKPAAFSVPHQISIHFSYARPWEKSDQSTSIVFWVSTSSGK